MQYTTLEDNDIVISAVVLESLINPKKSNDKLITTDNISKGVLLDSDGSTLTYPLSLGEEDCERSPLAL